MMKSHGIPVKRRTLGHIFTNLRGYNDTLLYFYTDSKVQGVTLILDDYLSLLSTFDESSIYRSIVVQDMVNTISGSIPLTHKDTLGLLFPKTSPTPYTPNEFILSKKNRDKILEKMKIYVGHFYGKNQRVLGTITKSMSAFKKLKYNVVIDGANVGFYKRGTMSGKKICFTQLYSLANQLSPAMTPLIVLHKNHIDSATTTERELMEKNKHIELFVVPKGADDDWFWLYAALSNPKSLLLTNDEMRNHFHYMNFESDFQDWKSTRVINYDMNPGDKTFTIYKPYPYLKRMGINMGERKVYVPFEDNGTIEWLEYSY